MTTCNKQHYLAGLYNVDTMYFEQQAIKANLFPYLPRRQMWVGKVMVHSFLMSTLDGGRHKIHILVSLPTETTHWIYGWVATRHILKFGETQKSLVPPLHWTPACPASNLHTIHYYPSNTNTVKKITVGTNLFILLSHMTLKHCTILVHTTILCRFLMVQHTSYVRRCNNAEEILSVQCKVGTEFLYFTWTTGFKQIINMHQGQYELWRMWDKASNSKSRMAAMLV
jgi:hypothetical protein